MHAQMADIPTNSLIEMMFLILTGELAVTATDVTEIDQIQHELHRRGEDQCWSFCAAN